MQSDYFNKAAEFLMAVNQRDGINGAPYFIIKKYFHCPSDVYSRRDHFWVVPLSDGHLRGQQGPHQPIDLLSAHSWVSPCLRGNAVKRWTRRKHDMGGELHQVGPQLPGCPAGDPKCIKVVVIIRRPCRPTLSHRCTDAPSVNRLRSEPIRGLFLDVVADPTAAAARSTG